jgi:hypothetical protein
MLVEDDYISLQQVQRKQSDMNLQVELKLHDDEVVITLIL